MDNSLPKPFSRRDTLVMAGCILLAIVILEWWIPRAATTPFVSYVVHVGIGVLGIVVVFLSMALYGLSRFVLRKQRWIVLGLVLLPALYAGLLVGSLRDGVGRDNLSGIADGVRSQDGIAALWWGKQAALDLPSWSRGGVEPWPTMSGDLMVFTHEDYVEVSLASDRSSPRECLRLLSEFSEQKSLLETVGGWVSIDGNRVSGNPETACSKGGIMALVARLPAEE